MQHQFDALFSIRRVYLRITDIVADRKSYLDLVDGASHQTPSGCVSLQIASGTHAFIVPVIDVALGIDYVKTVRGLCFSIQKMGGTQT